MGIPGSTYSHDFWGPGREYRDPLLPAKNHDVSNTGGMGSVVKCKSTVSAVSAINSTLKERQS